MWEGVLIEAMPNEAVVYIPSDFTCRKGVVMEMKQIKKAKYCKTKYFIRCKTNYMQYILAILHLYKHEWVLSPKHIKAVVSISLSQDTTFKNIYLSDFP